MKGCRKFYLITWNIILVSMFPVTDIKQQISAKRESRHQKVSPPPVPREKPHVFVGRGSESVDISWQSVTSDAPLYYIVERRCPPSRNWLEVATDIKDTSYTMTDYQSEKDYMLRVRAANDYGVSDPSPPTSLFAKIGVYFKYFKCYIGLCFNLFILSSR